MVSVRPRCAARYGGLWGEGPVASGTLSFETVAGSRPETGTLYADGALETKHVVVSGTVTECHKDGSGQGNGNKLPDVGPGRFARFADDVLHPGLDCRAIGGARRCAVGHGVAGLWWRARRGGLFRIFTLFACVSCVVRVCGVFLVCGHLFFWLGKWQHVFAVLCGGKWQVGNRRDGIRWRYAGRNIIPRSRTRLEAGFLRGMRRFFVYVSVYFRSE